MSKHLSRRKHTFFKTTLHLFLVFICFHFTCSINAQTTSAGILKAGQQLKLGDTLFSPFKNDELIYNRSGNLMLISKNGLTNTYITLWQTSITVANPLKCMIASEGSLTLYDGSMRSYWTSNTIGSGNYLKVDDYGSVTILNNADQPIWVNGQKQEIFVPPTNLGFNTLKGGASIKVGEGIYSTNKSCYLSLEKDGNLTLRCIGLGVLSNLELWKSNSPKPNPGYCTLSMGGDLFLYTADSVLYWQSKTLGVGNYLRIENNLKAVIYAENGVPWWTNGVLVTLPAENVPGEAPNASQADFGYGPLNINIHDYTSFSFEALLFLSGLLGGESDINIEAEGGDLQVNCGKTDVNYIAPQHRSVGETSALPKPKKTYAILEGYVLPYEAHVSTEDFPTSHYTHDVDCIVRPDPGYRYLLGYYYDIKQTPGCIKCKQLNDSMIYYTSHLNKLQECSECSVVGRDSTHYKYCQLLGQKIAASQTQLDVCNQFDCIDSTVKKYPRGDSIEVEWESGLAADNGSNPAYGLNSRGTSYGFFSQGHQLGDVIWNWPTVNDWIHVEGVWIWERGHRPAHSEIHPAHFMAIQRALTVSFSFQGNTQTPIIRNQADDQFIATRVDMYGSADGTAMWNTKGLHNDFVQIQDMNRKDYTFTIKHPLKKVSNTAILKWAVVIHKGDNFPIGADPIITLLPDNEVQVVVPWKSKNVPNTAVLARTVLVYWKDVVKMPVITPSYTKVLETEKPKLYQVTILKVNLLKSLDDDKDFPHMFGDFRLFCNVGNDWIFLNEFTYNHNWQGGDGAIFMSGLGWGEHESSGYSYNVNQTFNVYIPLTFLGYRSFRIAVGGWEADGTDNIMGNIINEYSRDKEAISQFCADHLLEMHKEGDDDDPVGDIDEMYTAYQLIGDPFENPSTLHATYRDKNKKVINVFNIVYTIKEIPYSGVAKGIPLLPQ